MTKPVESGSWIDKMDKIERAHRALDKRTKGIRAEQDVRLAEVMTQAREWRRINKEILAPFEGQDLIYRADNVGSTLMLRVINDHSSLIIEELPLDINATPQEQLDDFSLMQFRGITAIGWIPETAVYEGSNKIDFNGESGAVGFTRRNPHLYTDVRENAYGRMWTHTDGWLDIFNRSEDPKERVDPISRAARALDFLSRAVLVGQYIKPKFEPVPDRDSEMEMVQSPHIVPIPALVR